MESIFKYQLWNWNRLEFIFIPDRCMFQDLRPKKIKTTENIRQNFSGAFDFCGAPLRSGAGLGLQSRHMSDYLHSIWILKTGYNLER